MTSFNVKKTPPITVEGVTAAYNKTVVLENVDMTMNPSEVVGLVGLNGVGKTTLIKIILGLKDAESGSVKVFGGDSDSREARMNLAFLPEKFEPPSFLTGYEFLDFSQSLYKKKMDKEEVHAAALRLELSIDALGKRVTTYSKGMRQKLGLMATLLSDCSLLILDEPMTGLDPKARVLVKDEIANYHKRGRSVFICSHILADLDELCDRLVVVHDKQFRFVGKPAELKKQATSESLERAFLQIIEPTKKAA